MKITHFFISLTAGMFSNQMAPLLKMDNVSSFPNILGWADPGAKILTILYLEWEQQKSVLINVKLSHLENIFAGSVSSVGVWGPCVMHEVVKHFNWQPFITYRYSV